MIIINSMPVCNDQALRSVLVLFLIGRENCASFSTTPSGTAMLNESNQEVTFDIKLP